MNPAYPIEQIATGAVPGPQLAFARKARELLPDGGDFALEATRDGLLILGRTEADLAEPRRLLRDAFGADVRFSTPGVRLLYADGWQQPIMGFRVVAAPADVRPIEACLARRAAEISDVEVRPDSGVIRGQAPLATLLGYPRALRRLSGGTAHATLWLCHYRPLWSYSSETMACYPG